MEDNLDVGIRPRQLHLRKDPRELGPGRREGVSNPRVIPHHELHGGRVGRSQEHSIEEDRGRETISDEAAYTYETKTEPLRRR
jgi:hypothetical protein